MHSKNKGNIGVFAAAKLLSQNSINVFAEAGDLSKIDLIAEKNGRIVRIQVKSLESKDGSFKLSAIKTGPNSYLYNYKATDFDYFVIYVRNLDKIYTISTKEALANNGRQLNFRLTKPKNNQLAKIRNAVDYEGIRPIINQLTVL